MPNNLLKQIQLKSPVFEEFQHGFRVTIFKTPQKTPQKKSVRLKIIDLLLVEPRLSQRAVAEKLGISFDTAKEHFTKLKKENRIKRIGTEKTVFGKFWINNFLIDESNVI
jgi:ATP-dependent DNA helicase RecG